MKRRKEWKSGSWISFPFAIHFSAFTPKLAQPTNGAKLMHEADVRRREFRGGGANRKNVLLHNKENWNAQWIKLAYRSAPSSSWSLLSMKHPRRLSTHTTLSCEWWKGISDPKTTEWEIPAWIECRRRKPLQSHANHLQIRRRHVARCPTPSSDPICVELLKVDHRWNPPSHLRRWDEQMNMLERILQHSTEQSTSH